MRVPFVMVIAAGCASDPRPVVATPIPVSREVVAAPEKAPAPTPPEPKPKVVVVTSNPPVIELVQFDAGSKKPLKESETILHAVADVMKAHPEIELVQIEGHAGPKEKDPLKLSQERADATRANLIGKGVDGARLRTKGYGAYCPRGTLDRRVEFKIVTTNGKPMSTELGCAAAKAAGIVD